MFEDSLVESTHRIHAQNRWTFAVSVSVQAALAAAIVLLPLLHPETLQRLALSPAVLVAPPPPVDPPPPASRVVARSDAARSSPSTAAPETFVKAVFHSAVDMIIRQQAGTEAPPGMITSLSMISGTDPAGIGTAIGPGTGRAVTLAAPPKPLHVSSGVVAGLLLGAIQPAYPPIAKASHTEGTVIIHAIISKNGHIESANVLSGPAMLQGAAIDAVRVARYRPFLLNGEPTEVDTTITINFRLSSG